MTPAVAFKLIDGDEWRAAQAAGVYAGSAVDLADGYIHMSTQDQLAVTAAKHYAGRQGLVLLSVDLTVFGPELVWEPSRGGALFPHLYGPLPVASVRRERTLAVSASGEMIFEDGEAG